METGMGGLANGKECAKLAAEQMGLADKALDDGTEETNAVVPEHLQEAKENAAGIADALVQAALNNGGSGDNVTVIVLYFGRQ